MEDLLVDRGERGSKWIAFYWGGGDGWSYG